MTEGIAYELVLEHPVSLSILIYDFMGESQATLTAVVDNPTSSGSPWVERLLCEGSGEVLTYEQSLPAGRYRLTVVGHFLLGVTTR